MFRIILHIPGGALYFASCESFKEDLKPHSRVTINDFLAMFIRANIGLTTLAKMYVWEAEF